MDMARGDDIGRHGFSLLKLVDLNLHASKYCLSLSFFSVTLVLLVASVTQAVIKVTSGGLLLHAQKSLLRITAKSELIISAHHRTPGHSREKLKNQATNETGGSAEKISLESLDQKIGSSMAIKFNGYLFLSIEEPLTFVVASLAREAWRLECI